MSGDIPLRPFFAFTTWTRKILLYSVGILSRRSRLIKVTLPSCRAQVNKEWRYTSAPLLCLHDVDKEDFTVLSRYIKPKKQTDKTVTAC